VGSDLSLPGCPFISIRPMEIFSLATELDLNLPYVAYRGGRNRTAAARTFSEASYLSSGAPVQDWSKGASNLLKSGGSRNVLEISSTSPRRITFVIHRASSRPTF
jgi:hypothetical protein